MASRLLIFDLESLLQLMTHYSEGLIPLGAKPVSFAVSDKLPRWINLTAESGEWQDTSTDKPGYVGQAPLHFRYEAKRTMKITGLGKDAVWSEAGYVEAPRHG